MKFKKIWILLEFIRFYIKLMVPLKIKIDGAFDLSIERSLTSALEELKRLTVYVYVGKQF